MLMVRLLFHASCWLCVQLPFGVITLTVGRRSKRWGDVFGSIFITEGEEAHGCRCQSRGHEGGLALFILVGSLARAPAVVRSIHGTRTS